MKFSERMGFERPREFIQKDSMSHDLRIGLWNCVDIHFLNLAEFRLDYRNWRTEGRERIRMIYFNFSFPEEFRKTLDEICYPEDEYANFKRFFFKVNFFEVYNFCEFLVKTFPAKKERFVKMCNLMLERHLSGYRFVNDRLVRITSEEEIISIETACALSDDYKVVSDHIKKSLEALSKKPNPDYQNSISESCKAVEAMVRKINGDHTKTLGDSLKEITKLGKSDSDKILFKSLDKFWGYASQFGIRHADNPTKEYDIKLADAKLSLVMCSAWVNFFKEKY